VNGVVATKESLREVAEFHFPAAKNVAASEGHATGADGGMGYFNPCIVRKALKFYGHDYRMLGLPVPEWASKLAAQGCKEEDVSAAAQASGHAKGKGKGKGKGGPVVGQKYSQLLAVPSMKLLFCFIPQNENTQFNRLINSLNGLNNAYGPCNTRDDANGKSRVYKLGWTDQEVHQRLRDSTWTKAVFLRDPLERLTVAYHNRCEDFMQDCGPCPQSNFTRLTEEVLNENLANIAFLPQLNFCGLRGSFANYDYVGPLSDELLQYQADLCGIAVQRPRDVETTALGAAIAAGLGAGVWSSIADIPSSGDDIERTFEPAICEEERTARCASWQKAVESSFGWARE